MAIQFNCRACGKPIEVDDMMADRAVTCPYCRAAVTAPARSELQIQLGAPAGGLQQPGEEALQYAAPPPPERSILGYVSLACMVLAIVTMVYVRTVSATLLAGIEYESVPPERVEEVREQINERVRQKPSLIVGAVAGVCGLPLAGVICAVVCLARRRPPRWPAVATLCVLGAGVVYICVGIASYRGAGGQGF